MSDHFSTIGISINSDEDLQAILVKAAEDAETIKCKEGYYLRWSSQEGAEIWIQIDKNHHFLGATPYFRGKSIMLVVLTAQVPRSDDTPLEGTVQGWSNLSGEELENSKYPFVFDLVDKGCYETLNFPFFSPVQLCAFAHELQIYDSDEEYNISQQHSALKFASESFIPSGLFSDSTEFAQPYAIFSGHILETQILQNPLTHHSYHWIRTKTLGGEIDVVSDPTLMVKSAAVGGVISGSFWLCGRILNPQIVPKKKLSKKRK